MPVHVALMQVRFEQQLPLDPLGWVEDNCQCIWHTMCGELLLDIYTKAVCTFFRAKVLSRAQMGQRINNRGRADRPLLDIEA